MSPRVDFIDVSEHQGPIDWPAVPVPAIVKATEGRTFTDRLFATNDHGAADAGRLLGVYHFLTSTSPGADQAAHFLATVGQRAPLVYVLDWETDITGTLPSESTAQAFVDHFRRFASQLTLVVYGNAPRRPFATANGLPFWCAWYPPEGQYERVESWLRDAGDWAWQWSSSGTVPGIAVRVDVNTFLATPTMEGQTMTNEETTALRSQLGLDPVQSRDYDDEGKFTDTEPLGATQLAAFAHIEAQLAALAAEKAAAAADRASATANTVAVLVAQLQQDVATLVAPATVEHDVLVAAVKQAVRELLA